MTVRRLPRIGVALVLLLGLALAHGEEAIADAKPLPDLRDVAYGSHERQRLDLWRARTDGPAPLLVFVHGGGWLIWSKEKVPANLLRCLLDAGISVAAINYRYTTQAPLPGPVHDAARAVQFLRHHAREWGLDPKRVGALGNSAGGCSVLWLAFHDDLANPIDPDPVARESTRLCAAAGFIAQTSIDPPVIKQWIGNQVVESAMIFRAVGAMSVAELEQHYADYAECFREFSPMNHLDASDPPTIVIYAAPGPLPAPTPGDAIHHAMFGLKLKEKADAVGARVTLCIDGTPLGDERARMNLLFQYARDFLVQHLQQVK